MRGECFDHYTTAAPEPPLIRLHRRVSDHTGVWRPGSWRLSARPAQDVPPPPNAFNSPTNSAIRRHRDQRSVRPPSPWRGCNPGAPPLSGIPLLSTNLFAFSFRPSRTLPLPPRAHPRACRVSVKPLLRDEYTSPSTFSHPISPLPQLAFSAVRCSPCKCKPAPPCAVEISDRSSRDRLERPDIFSQSVVLCSIIRLLTGGRGAGFSPVAIVPDDAAGGRIFSGISRFRRPCIPELLYTHPASPTSALTTSMLRAAQISPLGPERSDCRFRSSYYSYVGRFGRYVSSAKSSVSGQVTQARRNAGRNWPKLSIRNYPSVRWSDFGKPWETEIRMVRMGIESGASRMRIYCVVIAPLHWRDTKEVGEGVASADQSNKPALIFIGGVRVAKRLACSPPKVIRVQFPAESFRIFSSGRYRWSVGFLGDLPFTPPFHSGAVLHSPQSPSSALKTSMLRAAQISSLTHSLIFLEYSLLPHPYAVPPQRERCHGESVCDCVPLSSGLRRHHARAGPPCVDDTASEGIGEVPTLAISRELLPRVGYLPIERAGFLKRRHPIPDRVPNLDGATGYQSPGRRVVASVAAGETEDGLRRPAFNPCSTRMLLHFLKGNDANCIGVTLHLPRGQLSGPLTQEEATTPYYTSQFRNRLVGIQGSRAKPKDNHIDRLALDDGPDTSTRFKEIRTVSCCCAGIYVDCPLTSWTWSLTWLRVPRRSTARVELNVSRPSGFLVVVPSSPGHLLAQYCPEELLEACVQRVMSPWDTALTLINVEKCSRAKLRRNTRVGFSFFETEAERVFYRMELCSI
ncbi:hypothetical protein PR048_018475 [Dryococelus australis]|uniref:Uncharacterized protein n=1 Tax=Dryococelus australis TaxID=614101 RepID=A0ABQ9HCD1_9NEOP|nr:hypothetical protein PR048_018475 [Dryococelus australis]